MKIKTLRLYDFRGVHRLELNLEGKSTILFGINGVGKSTILAAVNLLYASVLNRIVKQRFKQNISLELSDIKYGKASARIEADFVFENDSAPFPFYREITYENRRKHGAAQLDRLTEEFEKRYVGSIAVDEENTIRRETPPFNLPLFVNYGVNRLVLKTRLNKGKEASFGQYSAYERSIENRIDFDKLFEWFLEQEIFESQMKKRRPDFCGRSLTAVKKAMLAMLDGYHDIHLDAKPYSMRIVRENEELDLLQLSDGEKCTLALFGDIARRLALANPSLDDPLMGTGVVLIDEVELHMHPSWQRKVIPVLKRTFPAIQWIITTHSPQVLGEVETDFNIISMARGAEDLSCRFLMTLYGLDSNVLLEDILGTDSRNRSVKETTDRMYACIEKHDYDEAENMADLIDEMTLHRSTDTVRARVMIRRGRERNAQN